MKQEINKYLCGDCNYPIKKNQKACKNCGTELVWEIEKKNLKLSEKKNKFFLSDEIWIFILLILLGSPLILKNWNNIKSAEFFPTILAILYLIWNIIKRPLIILGILLIIYLIIKFIKRSRNN